MSEVRGQLEKLRERVPSRNARWRAGLMITGLALSLAVGTLIGTTVGRRPVQLLYKAPVRVTVESSNARYPTLSKDGKLLAYASDRAGNFDIYLKQVGGDAEVR